MKHLAAALFSLAALCAPCAAFAQEVKPAPTAPPTAAAPVSAPEVVTVVETFTGPDPARMFGGSLIFGDHGPWSLRQKPGAFLMDNASTKEAARFFHVRMRDPKDADRQKQLVHRSIEVDVEAVGEENFGGAGLICRFDRGTSTYVMFLINSSGRVLALARGADGKVKRLVAGKSPHIKPGVNTVAAVYLGTDTQFLINGKPVAKLSGTPLTGSDFGIAALGIGQYRFERVVMRGEREAEKKL
jgi:hypothetical protein